VKESAGNPKRTSDRVDDDLRIDLSRNRVQRNDENVDLDAIQRVRPLSVASQYADVQKNVDR